MPPVTWLRSTPPGAPQPQQSWQGQRLTLQWQAVQHDTPVTYNVYRLSSSYGDRLLARRLTATTFTSLVYLPALKHAQYVVTTVDAYGNESEPAVAVEP